MSNHQTNYVIDYMRKNDLPMTVSVYCDLNWPGKKFEELEGEDRAEVEDLIAEGVLKVPTQLNDKYKN